MTVLAHDAFSCCPNLTSVTIPRQVISIASNAVAGCDKMTTFDVEESNPAYKSVSGLLLTKNGNTLLAAPPTHTSGTIPDTVTSIGSYAFDRSRITSITIPNGVTSIGERAFSSCHSLTSFTIPNGVTSIGSNVFAWSYGLTSITIPDSVTSIGTYAFRSCHLTSLTIPNSVNTISAGMFYECSYCTKFDFRTANSVPTLANVNAFQSTSSSKEIIVPDSLYDDWIAASNWSSSTNNIVNCIVRASQSSLGPLAT